MAYRFTARVPEAFGLMDIEAIERWVIQAIDVYDREGLYPGCSALNEAHRCGIHPFCITIDETARDYLPHMYGAVNWTLVSNVRRLPVKVADIYWRLTT